MKEINVNSVIEEVWECKKHGYNIDIFPDGNTYCYCGKNYNGKIIKKYEHGHYNNFPKTKREIKSEIVNLFEV